MALSERNPAESRHLTYFHHSPCTLFTLIEVGRLSDPSNPDGRHPSSYQAQDTERKDTPEEPKNRTESVGNVTCEANLEIFIGEENSLSVCRVWTGIQLACQRVLLLWMRIAKDTVGRK